MIFRLWDGASPLSISSPCACAGTRNSARKWPAPHLTEPLLACWCWCRVTTSIGLTRRELYVHVRAQRRVRRVATPDCVSSPSQRLRGARSPAQIELSRLSGSSQVTRIDKSCAPQAEGNIGLWPATPRTYRSALPQLRPIHLLSMISCSRAECAAC